jgi:hypothetical protein
MEKLEGLPVAPFMDREKVTKPSAQIGFISFVLLPLFEALALLFPVVTVRTTLLHDRMCHNTNTTRFLQSIVLCC